MKRETALHLLSEYCGVFAFTHEGRADVKDAAGMYSRFPLSGSECKAMRWLGYAQGIAVARSIFTLEEVKEHSKRGFVYDE